MNAPVTPPTPSRPTSTRRCFRSARTPRPTARLTSAGVRVEKIMGRDMLVVEREALRALAEAAFIDIYASAAPGAPQEPEVDRRGPGGERQRQVRRLRLPQERQHRGRRRAADVPGHRHRDHHGQEGAARLHRRRRRGGARRGRARRVPQEEPALFAARAALHVRGEEHRQQHAGAGRDLRGGRRRAYKFLFIAKGGGSANKAFLYQATPSILTHDRMIAFLKEKILTLGTAACPPYHLAIVHRRHLGRADDEDGEARLDQVSRQPADARLARTATPSAISRWSRRC